MTTARVEVINSTPCSQCTNGMLLCSSLGDDVSQDLKDICEDVRCPYCDNGIVRTVVTCASCRHAAYSENGTYICYRLPLPYACPAESVRVSPDFGCMLWEGEGP